MLLGFEHIGMTCRNIENTLGFYCDLLGLKLVQRRTVDIGEVIFLDAGGGMLEILVPQSAQIESSRIVPPHEAGIRHLTLAYDDVDEVFERLEQAGVETIERPRPAVNTEMLHRVAFVRDPDGIFVELIERAASRA